ncbi:hypothetical protein [Kosmotoga pacifica]|uniref:Uncharacterized protein n=2 Tax=Kosmotoga pacifica TaxID=1330330 RepID=A0A0G2Z4Q4_9BACT|nr:hypothetical protein [Kosmotoga pacifica]AKI96590.1 hypothetical protein IX53_00750 [Kosmotoga pacifica]
MQIGALTLTATDVKDGYIEIKTQKRMADGTLKVNYIAKKKTLDVTAVINETDKATLDGYIGTSQTVTYRSTSWTMYVPAPSYSRIPGTSLYNVSIHLEEV